MDVCSHPITAGPERMQASRGLVCWVVTLPPDGVAACSRAASDLGGVPDGSDICNAKNRRGGLAAGSSSSSTRAAWMTSVCVSASSCSKALPPGGSFRPVGASYSGLVSRNGKDAIGAWGTFVCAKRLSDVLGRWTTSPRWVPRWLGGASRLLEEKGGTRIQSFPDGYVCNV